ncbi:hypothetical protein GLU64_00685 [Nanohaloarchaea archaeon]|nr:hypothetical protein [Candidatus Nanohaloarchaea archaeon]
MAFTLLTGAFFPQVSGEIGNQADMQSGRLEVMSIISTNLHGNTTRADDGSRLEDSQLISYLICGKNPSGGSVTIESGEAQLPDFYDEDINYRNDPGNCTSNDNEWNFRGEQASGDIARQDSYSTLLPVRGGGIAKVEVEYGVR